MFKKVKKYFSSLFNDSSTMSSYKHPTHEYKPNIVLTEDNLSKKDKEVLEILYEDFPELVEN